MPHALLPNLNIPYSHRHTSVSHLSNLHRLALSAYIRAALNQLRSRPYRIYLIPEISSHRLISYILQHTDNFPFFHLPKSIAAELKIAPLLVDRITTYTVD
jgi:hypothetical protein